MSARDDKGFVLWFTGLPCSGKTTVAASVARALEEAGLPAERIDGDEFRRSVSPDLGFSEEDRAENIARAARLCGKLSREGARVIASFVSPLEAMRAEARRGVTNFIEVFVDCPLEECRRRDVKGMYRMAEEGKIADFTGVSAPYEAPRNAEVVVHTDIESPEESCARVVKYLKDGGFI